MKRHPGPTHGADARGKPQGHAKSRPPKPPSRRPSATTSRHRAAGEPEPIRVPPEWMPSSRTPRRRKAVRITGKVALALAGFALLTLPFVINHLDQGAFYYQEVPLDLVPGTELENVPAPDVPVAPTAAHLPPSDVEEQTGGIEEAPSTPPVDSAPAMEGDPNAAAPHDAPDPVLDRSTEGAGGALATP